MSAPVKCYLIFVQVKKTLYENEKFQIGWALQALEMFQNTTVVPHAHLERNFHCIVDQSQSVTPGNFTFTYKGTDYLMEVSDDERILSGRELTFLNHPQFKDLKIIFSSITRPKGSGDWFREELTIQNKSRAENRIQIRILSSCAEQTLESKSNQKAFVKNRNYVSIRAGKSESFKIGVKCADDYPHKFLASPIIELFKHVNGVKFSFFILPKCHRYLLQDNLRDIKVDDDDEIDGSNVWDKKERRQILVESCSEAGKGHLHTPLDTRFLNNLPPYDLPKEYEEQLEAKDVAYKGKAWGTKDNQSYVEYLHHLVYLEECYIMNRLQRYNIGQTNIQFYIPESQEFLSKLRNECLISVEVKGLEENRPSVINNDVVYIWKDGTTDVEFEGRVVATKKKMLILILSPKFKEMNPRAESEYFNIRFTHSRIPWRSFHRGIDKADMNLLIPSDAILRKTVNPPLIDANDISHFLHSSLSESQRNCVAKTVNFQFGGAPSLILGPFGSGKSTTLAECIALICKKKKNSRILVCTLTNSAADLLCSKLSQYLNEKQMFRACSPYYKNVPLEVLKYTSVDQKTGLNTLPDNNVLEKYQLIVSTCQFTSTLYGVGMDGSFSHLIIDEAGQISLFESLIPVSLMKKESQIVLCGDFHQVGPPIHSKAAKNLRLDESPLEYLFKRCALYRDKDTKDFYSSILSTQFRCPELISKFPLELFYDDYDCNFTYAPNIRNSSLKPFVKFTNFRGFIGKTNDTASFFNPPEARELVRIVTDFYQDNSIENPSDIAILCEQYKHRRYLIETLRTMGFGGIFVSAVKGIQGKEFKHVFLSTVVSREGSDFVNGKAKQGIWSEKKLNTAMTRAICSMHVIGDCLTLSEAIHWRKLMEYCKNQGGFENIPEKDYTDEIKQLEEDGIKIVRNIPINHKRSNTNLIQKSPPTQASPSKSKSPKSTSPKPKPQKYEPHSIPTVPVIPNNITASQPVNIPPNWSNTNGTIPVQTQQVQTPPNRVDNILSYQLHPNGMVFKIPLMLFGHKFCSIEFDVLESCRVMIEASQNYHTVYFKCAGKTNLMLQPQNPFSNAANIVSGDQIIGILDCGMSIVQIQGSVGDQIIFTCSPIPFFS